MNPSHFIYEEKLKSLLIYIIKEDESIDKFRKELFSLDNFSLLNLYNNLDKSKKSFINLTDFTDFLSSHSIQYNQFSLRRLIRTYDKKGKFLLVYDDFSNIIKPRYQNEFFQEENKRNEEQILIDIILNECKLIEKIGEQSMIIRNSKDFTTFESFMLISKGKRYINIDNLKIFLEKYKIEDNKLEWIIYRLDSDNDKQVSYEEFQDIFFPFQNPIDEKKISQKEIQKNIKEIMNDNQISSSENEEIIEKKYNNVEKEISEDNNKEINNYIENINEDLNTGHLSEFSDSNIKIKQLSPIKTEKNLITDKDISSIIPVKIDSKERINDDNFYKPISFRQNEKSNHIIDSKDNTNDKIHKTFGNNINFQDIKLKNNLDNENNDSEINFDNYNYIYKKNDLIPNLNVNEDKIIKIPENPVKSFNINNLREKNINIIEDKQNENNLKDRNEDNILLENNINQINNKNLQSDISIHNSENTNTLKLSINAVNSINNDLEKENHLKLQNNNGNNITNSQNTYLNSINNNEEINNIFNKNHLENIIIYGKNNIEKHYNFQKKNKEESNENFNKNIFDNINVEENNSVKYDENLEEENISDDIQQQSNNYIGTNQSIKIKEELITKELYKKPKYKNSFHLKNSSLIKIQDNKMKNTENIENCLDNHSYSETSIDKKREEKYFRERRPLIRQQIENMESVTHYEQTSPSKEKYSENEFINSQEDNIINFQNNNNSSYNFISSNSNDYFFKKTNEPIFSIENFIANDNLNSQDEKINNQLIKELIDFLSDIIEKRSFLESLKESLCLKEDITLENLFYDFDISKNNEIKIEDFSQICKNFAIYPTNDQIFLLYKKYDLDLDRALNIKEFCEMILPIKKEYIIIISNRQKNSLKYNEISLETKKMIKELIKCLINLETYFYEKKEKLNKENFSYINVWNLIKKYSKNGKDLDKEEFKLFFEDNGYFYTGFEIEILFNELDLDKNGKINYQDFSNMMLNI